MAYIPTVWHNDNTTPLTAENLNKLEQGVKDSNDAVSVFTTKGIVGLNCEINKM